MLSIPSRLAACLLIVLAAVTDIPAQTDPCEGERRLLVGLAASLQPMADDLTALIERRLSRPGCPVRLELLFAGSGTLAQQARAGAPFDVLVLAGMNPAQRLAEDDLALDGRLVVVAENRLRLARPPDQESPLKESQPLADFLRGAQRIGIGDPETAPVGRYAQQVLLRTGLLPRLTDRLLTAENVTQLGVWLERGEVDFGFIYESDCARFKVECLTVSPPLDGFHDPIRYPALALATTPSPDLAREFLRLLAPAPGSAIFARQGLQVPHETASSPVDPAPTDPESSTPRASFWHPLGVSLTVGAAALILNLLLGVPLAWELARRRFRGKTAVEFLLFLPLVLPPTVLGYLIILALGRQSPVGAAILASTGWSLLFTWWGAVLASTLVSIPLLVIPLQAAFRAIPPIYFEEGTLLGLTPWKEFLFLGIPLAWRGLAAGLALSLARALGEFGATLMVAGNIPGRTQTLPVAVYSATAIGDMRTAGLYVLLLLVLALILVFSARLVAGRQVEFT